MSCKMDVIPKIMSDEALLRLIAVLQWVGVLCIVAAVLFWGYLLFKTMFCTKKIVGKIIKKGAFVPAQLRYRVGDKAYTRPAPLRLYWGAVWRSKPVDLLVWEQQPIFIFIEGYSAKRLRFTGIVFLLLGVCALLARGALQIIYM